jgi:hypothetical protein
MNADPATIRQAAADLAVDTPIYTARVVGDRLELRLYGGATVYWPAGPVGQDNALSGQAASSPGGEQVTDLPDGEQAASRPSSPPLERLGRATLRAMARDLGLPGWELLGARELRRALKGYL